MSRRLKPAFGGRQIVRAEARTYLRSKNKSKSKTKNKNKNKSKDKSKSKDKDKIGEKNGADPIVRACPQDRFSLWPRENRSLLHQLLDQL